jgi:nitric oxide reductase NorQ protein
MSAMALLVKPGEGFVETPFIRDIVERALSYLRAGFSINLAGPTGSGKTTLAFHIAKQLERPVVLIVGNEEVKPSSFIGGEFGYSRRYVVDRFISSVLKVEESLHKVWFDERLVVACRNGFTLIYDEFTRVRPEVNNILLPVLEDRMLSLPSAVGESYVKVHPMFRAILTSNPEEYAGVYKAQDALLDRVVTISLKGFDEETEIKITMARARVPFHVAEKIVRIVRRLRESGLCEYTPTVRSCIMIAKVISQQGISIHSEAFRKVCVDILAPKIGRGRSGDIVPEALLNEVLDEELKGGGGD